MSVVAELDDREVIVVPVDWLPRYGKDWHLFAGLGVMAVSRPLWADGIEHALREAGARPKRPAPGERFLLHVTCPLCGRDDQPIPGKRPTVDELGLLPRHR